MGVRLAPGQRQQAQQGWCDAWCSSCGAERGTPCPTCGARANASLRCLHPCLSLLPAFLHPRLHGAESPAAFAWQSRAALCVIQGSVGLQAAWSGQEAAGTSQAATPHWDGAFAELGGCTAEPQTGAGGGPAVLGAGAAPEESG